MKLEKIKNNGDELNKLDKPIIIAGPCSVENYDLMDKTGAFLKDIGVEYLRGGAFKPRTSPYSFQGLGNEGLQILKEIRSKYGLKIVSELMDARDIEAVYDTVDIVQIGSRNMYNYTLLKEVGKMDKTILLKRGMSATIYEWINAAEYIAVEGNTDIIMCERGIRTFEAYTRNTLDLNSIPVIKNITSLRVIVDPSHGTGRRELVKPMSMASIAAGADGVMLEIHPDPENSVSDACQSIDFNDFKELYKSINDIYKFINSR